jgi:hypothetical protein
MNLENDSKKNQIFIAKANPIYVVISYIITITIFIIFIVGFYFEYKNSNRNDLLVFLQEILFNWKIWFVFGIFTINFLHINFNSIEFLEELIVIKKWYWKTKHFRYSEILKVENDYEDGGNNIIIFLKEGKKLKVPAYLLNKKDAYSFEGEDLVEFIETKTEKVLLDK